MGILGASDAGLIGIAFFGGIFNMPNELDAARAAGSPTAFTIAFGVVTAILALSPCSAAAGRAALAPEWAPRSRPVMTFHAR